VQVREVAVPLGDVEAVADEELIRDREADVPDRQVVDEPAVGTVEQRHRRQRAGSAEHEAAHQVAQRQPGVDDVLDDDDVPAVDARVQVLDEPDRRRAARLVRGVAGELDEVDVVEDRDRARQVGQEDEARLQGRDQERLPALVVGGDLGAQLGDTGGDLIGGEIDLADARIAFDAGTTGRSRIRQEASFRPYRCPRRSMSRL
jgi:hypothetical protein